MTTPTNNPPDPPTNPTQPPKHQPAPTPPNNPPQTHTQPHSRWKQRTSRMTTPRPYPLHTLATHLGINPNDTTTLAKTIGINRRWIRRYRQWGLTEQQADTWATRTGHHPANIWPTYNRTDLPPAGLHNANRTTCPQGHPYTGTNNRGERICHPCHRTTNANYRKKNQKPQPNQTITP